MRAEDRRKHLDDMIELLNEMWSISTDLNEEQEDCLNTAIIKLRHLEESL